MSFNDKQFDYCYGFVMVDLEKLKKDLNNNWRL